MGTLSPLTWLSSFMLNHFSYPCIIQCSPFITHLIITHIWRQLGHVAPKRFYHGILQKNYRAMTYNFFVKLSLYNEIHL